ncbi:hypothetical protein KW805_03990 [Candidatus Pacearchaeota archaeon]|nr:hypothetical protein [Candidatus Pacearchaeota archaeon]
MYEHLYNTDFKDRTMKTLSLIKGDQYYCFRYEAGRESRVLDALVDMVQNKQCNFDWFDAAILSHQLGRHLAKELKAYVPEKPKPYQQGKLFLF